MILDVRTMYIAVAATCFIVAAALLTLRTRRLRQDGTLQWALGWALHGGFWTLLGLRGIVGDFLSIVIANTFFTAGYSFLYAAVRQFRGRSCNTGILLAPIAATFVFFWYFSAYAENLLYRIIFISLLSILQISGIAQALLRDAPVKERLSYWLTSFAFIMMAMVMLNRLLEALTLPHGQLSILHATTFRNAGSVATLGVVVLASIGFVLMIREQADEALRRSEERYRSLFNGMTEGFALHEIVCDQKNEPCDYRFLEINPAFERLTGLKRENVTGRLVSEVLPDIEPYWVKTYGAVALTGQPVQFENYSSALDKHYEVFAYCPAPRQFAVLFVDITDRKHAEEALAQAHVEAELRVAELQAVLDVAPVAIWIAHDPQCLRITGNRYTDEIMKAPHGANISATALPGDAAVTFRALRDGVEMKPEELPAQVAAATGEPVAAEMMDLVFSDGRVVTMIEGAVPLFDADGHVRGSVAAGADVTQLRQAEDALKKAHDSLELRVEERTAQLSQAYEALQREMEKGRKTEEQLRQAQKMEAVGTLAGGIAHDFNNILAAVIGFSEMARDETPEGTPVRRHMDRVFTAGMRGRELVKRILMFSRQAEQEKKAIELSSVVKETLALLRASLPSTIDISTNIASESGLVLADQTQIQQLVMNLCTNAAHAMRQTGGKLSIDLADFSFFSPEHAPDPTMSPGLYMSLIVTDTGEGMPPDVLERIFDPFFTTKAKGEGTGLGLSVVHGIVRSHGGSITVSSEPGKGSTFTIYLPKYIADRAEDGEDADSALLRGGSERVLFIDDEEALAQMGSEMLTDLGYQVLSRTSSREALALFRLDPSRFDLVITDMTMPELTGIELAREILTLRADMPVVLCTGFSHLVNADEARKAGVRAFVMKPLTRREIAKTIREVLDE